MFELTQVWELANVPVKSSRMIGTNVVGPEGPLGRIKEIVIDPHTGKVAYALVSFGGFFGLGGKLFAMPFSSLRYDLQENKYDVEMRRHQLQAAAGIDADNWPSISEEKWDRDIHSYFGRSPFWD